MLGRKTEKKDWDRTFFSVNFCSSNEQIVEAYKLKEIIFEDPMSLAARRRELLPTATGKYVNSIKKTDTELYSPYFMKA